MNRNLTILCVFGLCPAMLASGWAAEADSGQAKAIAEIKKLGGRVIIDEKSAGKPVIGVDLAACKVADAGLEHLKELKHLKSLSLCSAKVSDDVGTPQVAS